NPANNRVRLHMVNPWNYAATHDDPASYIPVRVLPAINRAVLAACDGLDGILDGVIDDPRRCRFDPAILQCPSTGAAEGASTDPSTCLTAPQVAALRKIYAGPHNPRTGALIFPGMYPGSEINPLGLERVLANAPDSGRPRPAPGLAVWTTVWKG